MSTETMSRARYRILATNFAILMLNYADRAVIGVVAPVMIAEFGFSKATFGWILAAFAFTYSPFGFIGGWLADRIGPRKTMAWAIAVWSTFTALTAAGMGFVSLLLIRLAFGAGEGPQATVTAKLMHNWFPRTERGTALGIANAATPLGGAIGTPLVVLFMSIANDNWRVPFIVLGVLGVFALIGWLAVVRDVPQEHPAANAAEVSYITGVDPNAQQTSEGAGHNRPAPVPFREWGPYLKRPAVWSTALAYFGYAWILWTFLSWFPTYLVEERGVDLTALAIGGAIPWVGGCIGLAAGGILTDWLVRRSGNPVAPRRNLVIVCLTMTALLFAAIGLVRTEWTAVLLMTAVVFFLYLTGAQYWLIVGEAVPANSYGAVSGAVQAFATLASIIAPVLTGYLVDSSLGWTGVFALAGAIAIVGVLALAIFGRVGRETPASPAPAQTAS
ncbi:MFS transporter [Epidermidibacterium keratini]|uniref:MFS transporter n=1 Tax=Epidermidibacterium keratini TaxID=1891644 RepID=UPI001CEF8137|nr:MFS transporter [Epidermidibacterium keratini]